MKRISKNDEAPTKKNFVSEKIRAAFLITELAPGGAEKALFQLIAELDLSRFEPVVYSLSGKERDLRDSIAPLFRDLGVEVVELGMKRATDLPRVFCRFRRMLKEQKPHFLQTFLFHANLLGRFAARAAGVPVVCAGIRVAERDAPLRIKLDYWTRRLVDAWVCVGNSVADFVRTVGKIPAEKIVSIPNGVRMQADASRVFAPADVLNANDSNAEIPRPFGTRKRILAVGRLTRQKGFDFLIENAKTWLTSEAARDWELWIVGGGEEYASLRQLIENKGLVNDVLLTGWRSDAPRLLQEAELFVLPSRWEGMPNALLEAMAAGKPVVCANVEGVAEVLGAAADEQSCEIENADDWREKTTRLMRDETKRRELGRRNRERVASEFSVESAARKYETLWLRLLKNKNVKIDLL